jgi:hypothetical protein
MQAPKRNSILLIPPLDAEFTCGISSPQVSVVRSSAVLGRELNAIAGCSRDEARACLETGR